MSDIQTRIFDLKKQHGFNVSDQNLELDYIQGEVMELGEALLDLANARSPEDLEFTRRKAAMELADIVIYCYGLSEMLDSNLDVCVDSKVEIFQYRVYQDGKKIGYRLDPQSDSYYRLACADALGCQPRQITVSQIDQCRALYRKQCENYPCDTPDFFREWMKDIILELSSSPINQ